jgi:hypothetical protein
MKLSLKLVITLSLLGVACAALVSPRLALVDVRVGSVWRFLALVRWKNLYVALTALLTSTGHPSKYFQTCLRTPQQ